MAIDVSPKKALIDDRYLGDGVYASFDGYQVWLDLRGQDSTTRIALEPIVLAALKQFVDEINPNFMKGRW